MRYPSEEPLAILLVEDDDIDAEAVERALAKRGLPHRLLRAVDGQCALRLLREEVLGARPLQRQPVLVLLDLNLPRVGGIEFLRQLRADPGLRRSVVVALSTSDDPVDRDAAWEANVAAYVVKSRAGEDHERLMDLIASYVRVVAFPG